MEDSILKCTKQILGLSDADEAFDLDVLTHINAALSTLDQLGVDPVYVEDATTTWTNLNLHPSLLALIRSYIPLKVALIWDPPTLSFLIDMKKEQIAEYEWRIRSFVETEDT